MIRFLQPVHIKKIMVFIAFAAPKNAEALFSWITGPVFSAFRTGKQGQFLC